MKYSKLFLIFFLGIFIIGCTSTPGQGDVIPDWFTNPPSDTKKVQYFAVSSKASILKDIEESGGIALYNQLVTSLGLSESESQKDDLSDFRDSIINLVKGSTLPGFTLIEKQINPLGSERVIYLLVELQIDQLKKIEDELEEILRAGSSASAYSDEAREYIQKGDIYRGAISYIKAALEAAESSNKFLAEKNLSSAIEQVKKITITKLNSPRALAVGQNGVFSASISSIDPVDMAFWNDISVKVSFRDRKKGSVIGDRFASLRSDNQGIVTFVHPSPGFTGPGRVVLALDFLKDVGSLEILKTDNSGKLEELIAYLESVRVSFDFDIISSAPYVPTGIFVLDSDFLRKPLETNSTAQGLKNGLSNAGFTVDLLDIDSNSLFVLSEKEFLRDIPYMVDSDIKRVVYGIAQITEFDDSATGFTVVTEAEIKVVDLDTGEILLEEILSKRVQGGESQSTINTSFKELGKSLSSLLIDKLP
ncbi:MAG: hypothetical protein JEY91_09370 [Spirochaetaceae bacterium]|nr:hypothetical protein [Spirochaetaceae bacterium]